MSGSNRSVIQILLPPPHFPNHDRCHHAKNAGPRASLAVKGSRHAHGGPSSVSGRPSCQCQGYSPISMSSLRSLIRVASLRRKILTVTRPSDVKGRIQGHSIHSIPQRVQTPTAARRPVYLWTSDVARYLLACLGFEHNHDMFDLLYLVQFSLFFQRK